MEKLKAERLYRRMYEVSLNCKHGGGAQLIYNTNRYFWKHPTPNSNNFAMSIADHEAVSPPRRRSRSRRTWHHPFLFLLRWRHSEGSRDPCSRM